MSRRIEKTAAEKLKALVPFGLGQTKPKHFRDMARIVWQNRDNLGYAWKVLTLGVCDGACVRSQSRFVNRSSADRRSSAAA